VHKSQRYMFTFSTFVLLSRCLSRADFRPSRHEAAIHTFEIMLIRLAMGKQPSKAFDPHVHTGRLTLEKIATCRDAWVKHLMHSTSEPRIAELAKYTFTKSEDEKAGGTLAEDRRGVATTCIKQPKTNARSLQPREVNTNVARSTSRTRS